MTLRVRDLQSDSDLDSIRNSCDVFVINELVSSVSTVLEMKSGKNVLCTFISIVNRVVSGEIYTAGKIFPLPPGVTRVTNSNSAHTALLQATRTYLAQQVDM